MEVQCLPLDLCDPMSFVAYQEKLTAERPEVVLLVNNAGCGYLGRVGETETTLQTRMVDLNVRALTAITHMTVPFMAAGGRILNVSSIASFCPNPRMTVYSSTKALCLLLHSGAGRGAEGVRDHCHGGVPRPHGNGISGGRRHHRPLPDL